MILYILLGLSAAVLGLCVFVFIVKPKTAIKKSGINMSLAEFYKNQSQQIPTIFLLELSVKYKTAEINLLWTDLRLFYITARIETENFPDKFNGRNAEALLCDVLVVMELVKEQGYFMSFQNVSSQLLSGKNPREIVASFVHTMWHGTQKA